MTRDEIIKMAKEAGLYSGDGPYFIEDATPWMIERFAALVAQAEREACAKVCELGADMLEAMNENEGSKAALSCAASIRLRTRETCVYDAQH